MTHKSIKKKDNTIYAFFSLISLLLSNYFIIVLLYADLDILFVSKKSLLIWSNSLFLLIITILFFKRIITSEKIKKIFFSLSFLITVFILSVLADRVIGLFIKQDNMPEKTQKGIIFEPNIIARFSTTEFDYIVKTNSIGIRDEEINIKKQVDKKRILCFGDSFTFGWEVILEQSWPKVLERSLLENGYKVEVINCGQGGQYTSTYLRYMEKAVPMLMPDLVLIGVLQLDDLAQLYENHFQVNVRSNSKRNRINTFITLKKVIKVSYKNTFYVYKKIIKNKVINVENTWQISSQNIISGFSRLEYLRYCAFSDSVKSMFESGNLNPGLLQYYMNFPDRSMIFNNPKHPATKFAIEKMAEDIGHMKEICKANHCQLVFINLPTDYYTGYSVIRNTNFDFLIGEYLFENNNIDSVYNDIANQINIPYFEMTDTFKNLSKTNVRCFLRYDGHPNKKGYYVIGRSIGEFLVRNKIIK